MLSAMAPARRQRPALLGLLQDAGVNDNLQRAVEELLEQQREALEQQREALEQQRAMYERVIAANAQTLTSTQELKDEAFAARDTANALLQFARGTLSKRWVLEVALMQCHTTASRFNATATAQSLNTTMTNPNPARVDILQCMNDHNLNGDAIVKLYGKLSTIVHGSGADIDSLKDQGTAITTDEHKFLLCVANKRFGIA